VYENKERHSHECLGEECRLAKGAGWFPSSRTFFYMRQYALPTIKTSRPHDHRDATTTILSLSAVRQPVLTYTESNHSSQITRRKRQSL